MYNNNKVRKIPLLTEKELIELGNIMHSKKDDELASRRFWNEIYKKRGLEYKQVFDKEDL